MAKKKNPDKPAEVPDPQNPEITPETVPGRPTPPFQEPEIEPEDDPDEPSPAEIPVPDEPNEPEEPVK